MHASQYTALMDECLLSYATGEPLGWYTGPATLSSTYLLLVLDVGNRYSVLLPRI